MEASVIAPTSLLNLVRGQKFHLLLSHLVESDPTYTQFYIKERKQGSFLILDNSAHEFQTGQDIGVLLAQADLLRAQEVVLPDVLFDYPGTVASIENALDRLQKYDYVPVSVRSWMIVPQGKTMAEWSSCLSELLDLHEMARARTPDVFPNPPTIGISKDYAELFGPDWDRCFIETAKAQSELGCEVHLLGWPHPLWNISRIAWVWQDLIRSTDSARALVYAYHEIPLDPSQKPVPYPGRPEGFFQSSFNGKQLAFAYHNIQVYRNLVKDPTVI